MKIKQRQGKDFFYYSREILKKIWRRIYNRKTKVVYFIIIIFGIFLFGLVFGLIISGYFGTFDNPSSLAIDILHSMGITDLRNIKTQIESNVGWNMFKFPFNYIRGQFSHPKKIFIDINFADYQKLEYQRYRALEANKFNWSGEDYVPATIRYDDKEIRARLRLKGDTPSHLKGDKWSFRIKIKNDETLFGMKTFSIQHPKERIYLNELVYMQALKKEDILALRYEFIEVVINGKNMGIYAIEEHFETQLIESNNRREGIILKFDEDVMMDKKDEIMKVFSDDASTGAQHIINKTAKDWFFNSDIESFDDEDILADPVLAGQFKQAKALLESFRQGKLQTHQVFDVDKLATYFAINNLLSAVHASFWNNIRFYYNPINSKLEPIGFDAEAKPLDVYVTLDNYIPNCFNNCSQAQTFEEIIFRDKIFFEKYVKELERVSEKSYLDKLFLELDEDIKRNTKIIHKENPFYQFSKEHFYLNQEKIKTKLNPIKPLHAYLQESDVFEEKIVLSVANKDIFPLEIINLVYQDSIFKLNKNGFVEPRASSVDLNYQNFEFEIPKGFELNDSLLDFKLNYRVFGTENINYAEIHPYAYVKEDFVEQDFIRQESNLTAYDFLDINEDSKTILIKQGDWVLNQSLILPKNYVISCKQRTSINLINGAAIVSYSNLQFSGTKENPIKIFSSDKTGQGLAVLNANETSNIKNVIFENLNVPSKQGWELTGAVSFYKSPVILDQASFIKANSEDALNIIDSDFEIKNSVFEDCFSDCFDDDFGDGSIVSSLFINPGDDGLDFSGAFVDIRDIEILNAGDKAVSVGEKSNVNISNIKISGKALDKSYIGIASKDNSEIFIKDSEISNIEYGFAVYEKKSEYAGAIINAENVDITDADTKYIVEKDSNLEINGAIIIDKKDGVYERLYG